MFVASLSKQPVVFSCCDESYNVSPKPIIQVEVCKSCQPEIRVPMTFQFAFDNRRLVSGQFLKWLEISVYSSIQIYSCSLIGRPMSVLVIKQTKLCVIFPRVRSVTEALHLWLCGRVDMVARRLRVRRARFNSRGRSGQPNRPSHRGQLVKQLVADEEGCSVESCGSVRWLACGSCSRMAYTTTAKWFPTIRRGDLRSLFNLCGA